MEGQAIDQAKYKEAERIAKIASKPYKNLNDISPSVYMLLKDRQKVAETMQNPKVTEEQMEGLKAFFDKIEQDLKLFLSLK